MNLALGAILLAILLTPPLVLMYFCTRGAHSRGMPKLTLLEYFLLSATFSLLMHGTAIMILHKVQGKDSLGLNFLFQILTSKVDGILPSPDSKQLESYLINFGTYIICMSSVSAAIGLLLREILTSRGLRMKRWLQRRRKNLPPSGRNPYYGNWWYFFRANEYDSEYEYLNEDPPIVHIDVLVDSKDATVLYSGILLDFRLKGDDLDFVYMNTIRKRAFSEPNDYDMSKLKEGREIHITPRDGLMAIPYSKVTNFYIRFVAPLQNPNIVKSGFYQRARPVIIPDLPPDSNPLINVERYAGQMQKLKWSFANSFVNFWKNMLLKKIEGRRGKHLL